jgi:uncharacterized cysteine cluster protein YcgN (CxxCxxCC family)
MSQHVDEPPPIPARRPPAPRSREQAPPGVEKAAQPFWRRKTLDAMNKAEWESLCDGCGRCCLVKLEDEDTGQIHFTDVACKLLDADACRCADYAHRRRKVRDCIKLTPETVRSLSWLPPSCAYRLIAEGRDLAWWHPLVSGSAETVHESGVSVRGRVAASETELALDDYPGHIVGWPGKWPRPVKQKPARKVGTAGRRRSAEV